MFDFLRNLTKSNEERQQETLSAYLDNGLTPEERVAFEEQLEVDPALLASLDQQRLVKQNLTELPSMRAPRNFTLDPALYGRPTPKAFFSLYPVLRTATAVAAVVLIFLFSLDLFSSQNEQSDILAQAPAATSIETEGVAVPEPGIGESAPAEEAADAAEEGVFSEPLEEMEEIEEEEMMEEPAAEEEVVQAEASEVVVEGESGGTSDGAAAEDAAEVETAAEEDEMAIVGGEDVAGGLFNATVTITQRLSQTETLDAARCCSASARSASRTPVPSPAST
jgi:hypothetical protein